MSDSHDLIPSASVVRERLERNQAEGKRLKQLLRLAEEVEEATPDAKTGKPETLKTIPPNGLKTDPVIDLKADGKVDSASGKATAVKG